MKLHTREKSIVTFCENRELSPSLQNYIMKILQKNSGFVQILPPLHNFEINFSRCRVELFERRPEHCDFLCFAMKTQKN